MLKPYYHPSIILYGRICVSVKYSMILVSFLIIRTAVELLVGLALAAAGSHQQAKVLATG